MWGGGARRREQSSTLCPESGLSLLCRLPRFLRVLFTPCAGKLVPSSAHVPRFQLNLPMDRPALRLAVPSCNAAAWLFPPCLPTSPMSFHVAFIFRPSSLIDAQTLCHDRESVRVFKMSETKSLYPKGLQRNGRGSACVTGRMLMPSPQIHGLKPNPQGDAVWRWGLLEMIQSRGWDGIRALITSARFPFEETQFRWGTHHSMVRAR